MADMQTDIEVLKSDVRGLSESVTNLGSKIDMMMSLQVTIVRLQSDHDNTRDAVDRAFRELSTDRVHAVETRSRVDSMRYTAIGIAMATSLLFGAVQWYVLEQIKDNRKFGDAVYANDRRLTMLEARMLPLPLPSTAGGLR